MQLLLAIKLFRTTKTTGRHSRRTPSIPFAGHENCGEVNALLNEHIEHVSNRVKELRVIEKNLKGLRSLCQQARAAKDCGILQSLGSPAKSPLRSSNVEHRNGCWLKTHPDGGYRGYDMDDVYPMLSMDLFGRPLHCKIARQ